MQIGGKMICKDPKYLTVLIRYKDPGNHGNMIESVKNIRLTDEQVKALTPVKDVEYEHTALRDCKGNIIDKKRY